MLDLISFTYVFSIDSSNLLLEICLFLFSSPCLLLSGIVPVCGWRTLNFEQMNVSTIPKNWLHSCIVWNSDLLFSEMSISFCVYVSLYPCFLKCLEPGCHRSYRFSCLIRDKGLLQVKGLLASARTVQNQSAKLKKPRS